MHIFEATRGVAFFATPQLGMRVDEISDMIEDRPESLSSRMELVEDLRQRSNLLFRHREDLSTLWQNRSDLHVVSFYESQPTPTVQKVSRCIVLILSKLTHQVCWFLVARWAADRNGKQSRCGSIPTK
jgi:hypothetical protein